MRRDESAGVKIVIRFDASVVGKLTCLFIGSVWDKTRILIVVVVIEETREGKFRVWLGLSATK